MSGRQAPPTAAAGGPNAAAAAPTRAVPPPRPSIAPGHVVLVGLMGAGKTTVGERLADELGVPFVDGDAALTALTGRDAATVAAVDGVPALADLEARVLLDALAAPRPSVIAAAASVVDDPSCRRALRGPNVAVVRLRARPRTLAARHGAGSHRRPLGPDLVAAFAAQSRARASRFAAVRPLVTIDVDAAAVDLVVGEALRAVRGGEDRGPGV
jgi:shikimate kinase